MSVPTAGRRARLTALLILLALVGPSLLAVATAAPPGAVPASHRSTAPAVFGHRAAAPAPQATFVNPFRLIQKEPAPMGIADFGVTGTTGTVHAYSYTTPIFQGNVEVSSMLTNDGAGGHYMTFQLNTVLVLSGTTQNFSYWIQDIASIDSSTKVIGWIDNIWNLSSPTAGLATTELTGNGTVNNYAGLNWYADSPGAGFKGNGVTLRYPTNISIRSVISTIGGIPHAAFTYNDGYGWVDFDNVSFNHGGAWKNDGFLVDGYSYTPIGIFYDAEWDYAGSGQGQHNVNSLLNMSLQYWNGHNYQSVPNAWNFGSDTAESLDNVLSVLGAPPANGSLYSHLTNGSGTLGLLYNASEVGTLSIATPSYLTGTITLNGSPYDYTGGASAFTLAPGEYDVALLNGGSPVDSAIVNVTAGGTTFLELPVPRQTVAFHETGLPSGTPWSVNVSGTLLSSTAPFLNTTEKAGGYGYAIHGVAGFTTPTYQGRLSVGTATVQVEVPFWTFNYSVEFTAYGLPSGTYWSVSLNGTPTSGTGGSVATTAPNGTYSYTITTVNAYLANPGGGTVDVTGFAATVPVTFVLHLGNLAGNVTPATAVVTVNGGAVALDNGAFNLSEAPGVYAIEATASGYAPGFYNITVTPGNTSTLPITLALAPGSSGTVNSGSGGLSTTETLEIVGAVVVVLVVVGIGLLMVRRNRR